LTEALNEVIIEKQEVVQKGLARWGGGLEVVSEMKIGRYNVGAKGKKMSKGRICVIL